MGNNAAFVPSTYRFAPFAMPHSKQRGFGRDVINSKMGHILCDWNPPQFPLSCASLERQSRKHQNQQTEANARCAHKSSPSLSNLIIERLGTFRCGYRTGWIGEGEIAAWELRAGCKTLAAYWLEAAGAIGLFISPARVWRASLTASGQRTLYCAPTGWQRCDAVVTSPI